MRSQVATLITLSGLLGLTAGQQIAAVMPETHPKLATKECKNNPTPGGAPICTTLKTSIVLENYFRDLLLVDGPKTSCLNQSEPIGKQNLNSTICSDPITCTAKCGLNGIDYAANGVTVNETDNSMTMIMNTPAHKMNNGVSSPRVYLLSQNESLYQMFHLKNMEFTYDVDMSQTVCGTNGALYFIAMKEDGGMADSMGKNKAGAYYGTGYCDAQCGTERFIDGVANFNATTLAPNNALCCAEMDIWEANSASQAYTPHVCTGPLQSTVPAGSNGTMDGGICDKSGCAFNPYRMGNQSFYGRGDNYTLDSTKPMTVVTQFITSDNTTTGMLTDIRRMYVQNGKKIMQSNANWPGIDPVNSITDAMCDQQSKVFGNKNVQSNLGGLTQFSKNLELGMVLSMSFWASDGDAMDWLDSTYPMGTEGQSKAKMPGVARGSCDDKIGLKATLEKMFPDTSVKFSNIRWGEIGSTL